MSWFSSGLQNLTCGMTSSLSFHIIYLFSFINIVLLHLPLIFFSILFSYLILIILFFILLPFFILTQYHSLPFPSPHFLVVPLPFPPLAQLNFLIISLIYVYFTPTLKKGFKRGNYFLMSGGRLLIMRVWRGKEEREHEEEGETQGNEGKEDGREEESQ